MLGSRGTGVRLAIAAAALLIGTALFPPGEDAPRDAADAGVPSTPEFTSGSPEASERLATAETPASRAILVSSQAPGEAIRRSAAPSAVSALPTWAREALGADGDPAARVLMNRNSVLAGGELDARDLAVLMDIIAASGLSESSSPFDYDDGNGILEPWELGFQVWENGRLVLLATGPSPHFSFGYQLLGLPDSIGGLSGVRVLALHGSELEQLPGAIGSLEALRELRLHDNRLSELPRSIGGLGLLRILHLSGNGLSFLPAELGFLDRLEILNASDNPLTLIEDGALGLGHLRVLRLERTRRSQRPGTPTWGQLRELPDELASLPLEDLRVGGNLLYCAGGKPAWHLTNGSIASVVGLGAQRCGSIR